MAFVGTRILRAGTGSEGLSNGVIGYPLAVPFFLVLRLQLTQQGPGQNDGQADTHDNSKDDQNNSHGSLQS